MRPGGRSARCARRLGSGPGFRFWSGLRFCSHRADGVSHFALNGLGLELLSFAAEFVDHPEESGAPLLPNLFQELAEVLADLESVDFADHQISLSYIVELIELYQL